MAPAARNGVYLCLRLGESDIRAELGDLGRERRLAEHKLSRTSGEDCPQIKIPDLTPTVTLDTLRQENNIFPRAELKANAGKVRPAHEPLPGQGPVPATLSRVQSYTGPQTWPGAEQGWSRSPSLALGNLQVASLQCNP